MIFESLRSGQPKDAACDQNAMVLALSKEKTFGVPLLGVFFALYAEAPATIRQPSGLPI
jgi:hypothetical protein